MTNQKLTNQIITAAIDGFEAQKLRIDAQLAELRGMLDGSHNNHVETSASPEPTHRGRKMSAAARKRMADAQTKRWAASRGEAPTAPAKPKAKRKLSAAGKAAIVAALKTRWAAKRAENSSPAKSTAPTKRSGRKAATKESA